MSGCCCPLSDLQSETLRGGRKGGIGDALDRSGRGDGARQPGRFHELGTRGIDRDAALAGYGATMLVQLKVAAAVGSRRFGVHHTTDVVNAVFEVDRVVVADAELVPCGFGMLRRHQAEASAVGGARGEKGGVFAGARAVGRRGS